MNDTAKKVKVDQVFSMWIAETAQVPGPTMVTDMTLLQNAEFKEAFDEFDKVHLPAQM